MRGAALVLVKFRLNWREIVVLLFYCNYVVQYSFLI
jgi:hypothetical protein